MDMVTIAQEDFNIWIKNSVNELSNLYKNTSALSMESFAVASMPAISEEGLISWFGDKLKRLGQKFTVLVNKLLARFSSRRAELERNIEIYRQNPDAKVELPVSPRTLAAMTAALTVGAAGIAAITVCVVKKDSGESLKKIIEKIQNVFKKNRAKAQAEGNTTHEVSSSEAAAITQKAILESKKVEEQLAHSLKIIQKETQSVNPNDPQVKQKFSNLARATHSVNHIVTEVDGVLVKVKRGRSKKARRKAERRAKDAAKNS